MERLPNAVEEIEEMDSVQMLNEDILSDSKDNQTVLILWRRLSRMAMVHNSERAIRELLQEVSFRWSPWCGLLMKPLQKDLEKIKQNVYEGCSKVFVVKPSVAVARDISITVPSGGYFNTCSFMWTCYPGANPNQVNPTDLGR